MGQRSGPCSYAGGLYGAAIIVGFSKVFSLNPPAQISLSSVAEVHEIRTKKQ
jgi:hypothetical protein